MHRLTKLFVATVLGTTACGELPEIAVGQSNRAQAIIGGTPATVGEFPAVGTLLIKGYDEWFGEFGMSICTGTLVAPDTVLLAAHCVDTDTLGLPPGTEFDFYFSFALDVTDFGSSSVDLPPLTTRIDRAVKHPSFDIGAFDNGVTGLGDFKDIAVAFLDSAVTDRAPAMVMEPDDSSGLVLDAEVLIVGYGIRTADYDPYGGNPDDAGIQYRAVSRINEIGPYELQIGDYAPVPQKCHGDSGGPTFLAYTDGKTPAQRLIGVTSHAYDETDCNRGGVDTRVDVWREWIETQLTTACTNGWRIDCTNGGVLPVPTAPRPPTPPGGTGGTSYYTPAEPDDGGCNATGAAGLGTALAPLLLLVRRRARLRAR